MNATHHFEQTPDGWLGFELSVLRRLKIRSLANPFAGEADLDFALKRWGVRVSTNDVWRWSWSKASARVENNSERLSVEDVALVLEDAYVPHYRLANPSLRKWFGETDAWWFDNVRRNAEQLSTPTRRALALHLGVMVGDYVLSFDDDSRELRQPLSRVFQRLWESEPRPVDNSQSNKALNKEPREFLSSEQADCLFLRLPRPARRGARHSAWAWREEWVRGGDGFWDEFEGARAGRLGARAETRQQYLRHVEELLSAAAHIPAWAVAFSEDGLINTEEMVETIRRARKVGTVYTKDFAELVGARAVMVTA